MSKYKKEFIVKSKDTINSKLTLKNIMSYMLDTSNAQSEDIHLLNEDLLKKGLTWMIYKWNIKIFQYPRENQKIEIVTWASGFKNLIAYREFEIYRDGKVIGFASTEFILVDFEKKKPIRIPIKICNAYGIIEERCIDKISRINPSKKLYKQGNILVKEEDIDLNAHVNNLCYVDYIKESLKNTEFYNLEVYELILIYMKEITYPNKVEIDIFKEDKGLSFMLNTDGQNAKALVKFK